MCQFNKKALLLALPLLIASSVFAAEGSNNSTEGFFIGAQLKHAEFDGGRKDDLGNKIRRGTLAGIELGKELGNRFAVRLSANHAEVDSVGVGTDDSGMWYVGDLLYRINSDRNYLILGADYIDLGSENNESVHLGLGMRYDITSSLALTGEAAAHYGLDEDYTDFTVGLGMRYYFGKQKTTQKEAVQETTFVRQQPKDSDIDSVVDSLDECPDTPRGYVVDRKGCILYRQEIITRRLMVNFDNNSSVVKKTAMADIEALAEFMREHPQLSVVIEGHTSVVGGENYNQWLSKKRADVVAKVLTNSYAIDGDRISTKGFGETDLLLRGDGEKIHAANRRIMAVLSVKDKVGIRK